MYQRSIYKRVFPKGQDNKTMKYFSIQNYKDNINRYLRSHTSSAAGFTLVESLVAISILMIAIASPMYLAQKSLSSATLSKDQMVATFLAQDAIEAVRNIRDQIAVSSTGGDWLGTLLSPCICTSPAGCNFDSLNVELCVIDSTTPNWNASSIYRPNKLSDAILKISNSIGGNFLKYDYNLENLPSCVNNPNTNCSMDSKFTRYINIKKDPANSGNQNEAVVNVRVSWDSSLGPQKVDIQDFLYNFSENL